MIYLEHYNTCFPNFIILSLNIFAICSLHLKGQSTIISAVEHFCRALFDSRDWIKSSHCVNKITTKSMYILYKPFILWVMARRVFPDAWLFYWFYATSLLLFQLIKCLRLRWLKICSLNNVDLLFSNSSPGNVAIGSVIFFFFTTYC